MAFDPALPLTHSEIESAVLRDQFNGLKELIDAGIHGPPGPEGSQGPPGEVTTAALDAAIAGTSTNSNAVATWDGVVSDPPTQAQVQAIGDKLNELILALRR